MNWCAAQWLDETPMLIWSRFVSFFRTASSQVGFSLGVLRGNGLLGGLAAWFAFTMPSALILSACHERSRISPEPVPKVSCTAQACRRRGRCHKPSGHGANPPPDRGRAGIALAAIAIVVFSSDRPADRSDLPLGACAALALPRRKPRGFRASRFPVTGWAVASRSLSSRHFS